MDYRNFQIAQTRSMTRLGSQKHKLLKGKMDKTMEGKMQEQLKKPMRRQKWSTKLKDDALKTEIARDFFKPVMHRHVTPLFS